MDINDRISLEKLSVSSLLSTKTHTHTKYKVRVNIVRDLLRDGGDIGKEIVLIPKGLLSHFVISLIKTLGTFIKS